jgi:hypothetical protein
MGYTALHPITIINAVEPQILLHRLQLKHHLVHIFIYIYNMFQPPDDGPMWPKYVVNIYRYMDYMVF